MFISTLDLFKVGLGPSSSHTMGPMSAAFAFREYLIANYLGQINKQWQVVCVLKGSLAHTGIGHGTDKALVMGGNATKLLNLDVREVAQFRERAL